MVIFFNVLLVLGIFLVAYADFLYVIMFAWGIYVVPISLSLLSPKLDHQSLKDYINNLNRADNIELLFVHEGNGVEQKEKVPGLLFIDKTKPFKLKEKTSSINEIEVFHGCKVSIKEREAA